MPKALKGELWLENKVALVMGSRKGRRQHRAAELSAPGSGVPKAVLARAYGISRETVYPYLRQARLGSVCVQKSVAR